MVDINRLSELGMTLHLMNIPIAFVLLTMILQHRFTNPGYVCSGDGNEDFAEQYLEMTGIRQEWRDFSDVYLKREGAFLKYVALMYLLIVVVLFNMSRVTSAV